ncbi:hypothetical protein BSZ07_02595 [Streptomyces sp. M1013]|uniref:hypothetical protein n=1 Tax=Streptomyces sp. M1013 TaxID=549798 RepID=UPI000978EE04|nr:hypothetical protein [Streptomyces sp. M1013]OMI91783.1 hypothetical protein BSZ07_02595 [Streptomyces sp. M1013]
MNDSRTTMAAAVAGGYLLGRTKKAKLAFAVGSYLVGRRVGLSPGRVLGQGLGSLRQAPQFQELSDQVRGELLTAGRSAVTAAANRRLTGLADSLRDRTDALTGEGRGDDGRDDHDDSWDEDAPDEEAPDEDAYFDEEDREEDRRPAPAPPRKSAEKAAKRPPAKKTAKKAAKKTAAKKAVPAKRTAGPGDRRGGGRG